jgi:hypothetical protein
MARSTLIEVWLAVVVVVFIVGLLSDWGRRSDGCRHATRRRPEGRAARYLLAVRNCLKRSIVAVGRPFL